MNIEYIKTLTEKLSKTFAQNLRFYMNEKGINQESLAKEIHVSQSTVSSWLNAANEPSAFKLCLLSEVFNCTVEDLLK